MKNQAAGFTLVEIMIGLLLGSILLGAIFQHYLNTRQHYATSQQQLNQGYDLQMVVDMLRTNIRQAGFTPCAGIGWLIAADRRDKPQSLAAISLRGDAKNSMTIKRMGENFTAVNRILNPYRLLVEAGNPLSRNQSMIIADCFHAEIATIDRIQAHGESLLELTLKSALRYTYLSPAYVGEWLEEQFFVQKNKTGQPALYYQSGHAEELSTAIHSFFARLSGSKKRQVLEVTLGLADKQQIKLNTAVRIL